MKDLMEDLMVDLVLLFFLGGGKKEDVYMFLYFASNI